MHWLKPLSQISPFTALRWVLVKGMLAGVFAVHVKAKDFSDEKFLEWNLTFA